MGELAGASILGLDDEHAARICEQAEMNAMWATYAGASDQRREALGIQTTRIGGGVVLVMAEDPTGGFFNKVLGHGITEPVTDAVVGEIVEVFANAGAPAAAFQIAPAFLPPDWDEICAHHGLVGSRTWMKMLRSADEPARPGTTDLTVRKLGPTDARAFGEVTVEGFEMPSDPRLVDFAASFLANDELAFWGAFDGEQLVSVATLHIRDRVACLAGAATLPSARGRGAQSVLMAARIDAARDAGCDWISAETGAEEVEGEPNPSLHNMRRAGLVDMYGRRNFVWRPNQ